MMAEITVNVVQFKKEDNLKQFYFNADINVREAKQQICNEFDPELDAEK